MGRKDKPISQEGIDALPIGARLRQVRQEKGLSLTEIANRLGYTKGYLSGVETNIERPSPDLVQGYEQILGLSNELSEMLKQQRAKEASYANTIAYFVNSAPTWLDTLRNTLLDKGLGYAQHHLDEEEQLRHLELVLKGAAERGLSGFQKKEERDQYRDIITTLSKPGPYSDTLRNEVMRLFIITDTPNFTELSEVYNRTSRTSEAIPSAKVDITKYLNKFFEALIAELYVDPFFRQQMSDVLRVRAAMSMQRSLEEVVAALRQIGDNLADHYIPEQFARDVAVYTAHIERTLRYLKLVGVVPKDRGEKNADPELDGIFVPLRIALQNRTLSQENQYSITALLGQHPYLILLGEPGSGKSTVTRHLAWSHAVANQSHPSMLNLPLLSGNPLPLRIELRRLAEDRRQNAGYSFLSYATEVLLEREGVKINPQMFQELLERRAMLLLFDGLDEVATLDERRRLVEEIEHFALCYPGNRIIVTSRPVGYELASFSNEKFMHAQIQQFNDSQIQQFLERWYTHVLRLFPVPHDDQQELEALLTTLKENGRLHKLAENPLLLTIIIALHRYERLPDRRVLVYDRCANFLI